MYATVIFLYWRDSKQTNVKITVVIWSRRMIMWVLEIFQKYDETYIKLVSECLIDLSFVYFHFSEK